MSTYKNGQLPASALTLTSGGKSLTKQAAASYERLSTAFSKRFGKILRFNTGYTGYRTYAQQVALAKLYKDEPGRAAIPGTSNHGWGLAGDFNLIYGSDEWKWMNTEGRKYGWVPLNENNLRLEPWHWVYNETKDTKKPKPKPPVEDEMPTVKSYSTTATQPIVDPTKWQTVKFTDEGGTSIASNPKAFQVDVKIRLSGVKVGDTVQARVYRVDAKADGTGSVRTGTYDLIERPGSSGDTFIDLSQIGGESKPATGKSNRIRVEIVVPTKGAKIVKATAKSLTW